MDLKETNTTQYLVIYLHREIVITPKLNTNVTAIKT